MQVFTGDSCESPRTGIIPSRFPSSPLHGKPAFPNCLVFANAAYALPTPCRRQHAATINVSGCPLFRWALFPCLGSCKVLWGEALRVEWQRGLGPTSARGSAKSIYVLLGGEEERQED